MAYVPGTGGNGRQAYLQRPRFLALAEFGPRNLVYHEGRSYRVVRALLSLQNRDSASADARLPTMTVRICRSCGAGHFSDDASMCHGCGDSLGSAEIVSDIYRIENVGTTPTERITANDEERQRQGYELQTTFEWATREGEIDVQNARVGDGGGSLLRLAYGPGATITRINKGLRRRANRTEYGYWIDPVSGYWAKNEDETEAPNPDSSPRQRVVPCVRDQKNALLLQPEQEDLPIGTLATLEHALLRGIETVFQLEQGEILAEPMPTRDACKGFLFYEASEGGAGALSRLVAEPDKLAEVAHEALFIMHFDVKSHGGLPEDVEALTDQADTSCVAACYRCLLSYYNQPDHELLDRRDDKVRDLLLRMARARTTRFGSTPSRHPSTRPEGTSDADPMLARWLIVARQQELPEADRDPLDRGGGNLAARVAVTLSRGNLRAAAGSGAQSPRRQGVHRDCAGAEDHWPDTMKELARAMGRDA